MPVIVQGRGRPRHLATAVYPFLLLVLLTVFCPGRDVRAETFIWPEAAPGEVNIDPRMISDLAAAIVRGDYGRLKSLLILRHGLDWDD